MVRMIKIITLEEKNKDFSFQRVENTVWEGENGPVSEKRAPLSVP